MNNSNNDPVLEWMADTNTDNGSGEIPNDLLDFLLGNNAHTPMMNMIQNNTTDIQQPINFYSIQPTAVDSADRPIRKSSQLHSSHSEEDEEALDEQLKSLPSKERRQLRNKISARNFRNRRKEYMSTLETKMNQIQAENSQLKLEVKWVRAMMDKIQAENDRLRLELVLCKEGIQPQRKLSDTTTSYHSSSSSNAISTTDVITEDTWNLVCPAPTCVDTSAVYNNVYIAHASIPDWDMTSILAKPSPVSSTHQQLMTAYPLLAPALMSVVINQAMTMTTDELMSHAQLDDPTLAHFNMKQPVYDKMSVSNPLFHNILQVPISTEDIKNQMKKQNITPDDDTPLTDLSSVRPLYWIQRQFCNFIMHYVVVRYPQLDSKCRTYLPVCQKFKRKQIALI